MRHLIKFTMLAGAMLAVSACNRAAPAVNNSTEVGLNESLETPGNDASAIESVTNAPLPPPPPTENAANTATPETAPPPPSTPNVESNVAGM
ncbi:MAG TPA: hypothetical protein VMG08_15635 [Allosphingosinicella sp.]|nr:hypothetical protein [Allosphingosinicella sp.]